MSSSTGSWQGPSGLSFIAQLPQDAVSCLPLLNSCFARQLLLPDIAEVSWRRLHHWKAWWARGGSQFRVLPRFR